MTDQPKWNLSHLHMIDPDKIVIDAGDAEHYNNRYPGYTDRFKRFVRHLLAEGLLTELPAKPVKLWYCPVGGVLEAKMADDSRYLVHFLEEAGDLPSNDEIDSYERHLPWRYLPPQGFGRPGGVLAPSRRKK